MSGIAVKDLKIMVDTKAKKVVFAEAGKDFVDFIFHILSLPLATVVSHLNDKGMSGSLESIYKSFRSLESEYFEPNIDKNYTFKPSMDVIVPSLSLTDAPSITGFYTCIWYHKDPYVSSYNRPCPVTNCTGKMITGGLKYKDEVSNASRGFVKPTVRYMVTDDLGVKPMTISLLKDHINRFDFLEEKVVQVGVKEAVEILKASLETKAVLTTVFLAKAD